MDWLVLLIAVILTLNNSLLIKYRILFGFTSQYSVPFIGANIIISFNIKLSIDHNLSSACTNVEQDRISSNIDELSLLFDSLVKEDRLLEAVDLLLRKAGRSHYAYHDLLALRGSICSIERSFFVNNVIEDKSYNSERDKQRIRLACISKDIL